MAHTFLDSLPPSPQTNAIRAQIDNPQALKQWTDAAVANSLKQQEFENQRQVANIRANTPEAQAFKAALASGAIKDASEWPAYKEAQTSAAAQSPQQLSLRDWLAKNPGKGPSDYEIAMKKIVPQFTFNMQQGALQGNAIDLAAQNYLQTGQMPAGMRSPGMSSQIINRAGQIAQQNPDLANLAGNRAAYEANKQSLESLQKNFDQVNAFENTAGKNLDQFLSTAQKVVDSGSPWINKPLRSISGGALGSADQAAFNAARTTALTEIAKVLNSSTASGVLSDSARSEVSQLIGPNASLAQIVSAAKVLKTDMANRHTAYQEQIGDIQKRLGGVPKQTQQQAQPGPSAAARFTVGQQVTIKGKQMTITAVHPDGSFDAK